MKVRGECGAGLIELAVAMLVLSIGTLGLARGQLAARQASGEALQRSEAVLLGSGLLEQVRGNTDALPAYSLSDIDEVVKPEHDCAQASCDAMQWGSWNLWYWLQGVRGSAVSDENGTIIAGLIAPQACLSTGLEESLLELSWMITPSSRKLSCSEFNPQAGVRIVSFALHIEATPS